MRPRLPAAAVPVMSAPLREVNHPSRHARQMACTHQGRGISGCPLHVSMIACNLVWLSNGLSDLP
eukprot:12938359-Prorocentrum_lima.AAC.1